MKDYLKRQINRQADRNQRIENEPDNSFKNSVRIGREVDHNIIQVLGEHIPPDNIKTDTAGNDCEGGKDQSSHNAEIGEQYQGGGIETNDTYNKITINHISDCGGIRA